MKKVIRFLCFVIVLCVILTGSAFFFNHGDKYDVMHLNSFFSEPKNTLDVSIIGASEVFTAFNSTLAWKDYGFTSHSFCYNAMPCSNYKLAIDEILKHQNPKLIVIEFNGFLNNEEYITDINKLHTILDNIPKDEIWVKYIKELVPKEKQAEFFCNFIKYHGNWKHIEDCMRCMKNKYKLFKNDVTYTKAFITNNKTNKEKFRNLDPELCTMADKMLTDLLEHCKEVGLKNVLFVRLPHCVKNIKPEVYENFRKRVEAYGYDFLNYENSFKEIGLDPVKDFYNNDHMNVFGMQKFTPFFAKYITEHYDVKTQHSQETIDLWNKCAEKMPKFIERCEKKSPPEKRDFFYEVDAYTA